MSQSLSPFQFSIQANIDGHSFDYLLTVDEIGHVYQAQALIFDLPASAQKMILGESNGQLNRKIRAHAGLFKYLVPLALAGKLPTYQEQLAPLMEEINRRLQEKGLQWANIYPEQLSDNPANEVLMLYGKNNLKSATLKSRWEKIIALIEQQERWPSKDVQFLGSQHPKIAIDFFPAITPFYAIVNQAMFYENLPYSQSEVIKHYLLEELREPSCTPYANGIIYALEKHASAEDLSIYQAVINFYNRVDPKKDHLSAILSLLKHYPLPRTREICLDVMDLNDPYITPDAVKILLLTGMPEEEIVKLQLPLFKSGDADVSRAAFSSFAEHISGGNLPSANEVMDVYVLEMINNERSYAVNEIPAIAIKTKMHLISHRLYELLEHEHSNVRFGILAIINGYFEKDDHHFLDFLTPKFIDRYWDMVDDSSPGVASRALLLLGRIGLMTNRADYIGYLIEICRNAKERMVKNASMEAINCILRRVRYTRQVEAFYLELLEDKEDEYAYYYVLQGLRFSPNRAFKQALWEKYKDHPIDSVRFIASRLFVPTYRRWMGIRIRILNLLNKILANWPGE